MESQLHFQEFSCCREWMFPPSTNAETALTVPFTDHEDGREKSKASESHNGGKITQKLARAWQKIVIAAASSQLGYRKSNTKLAATSRTSKPRQYWEKPEVFKKPDFAWDEKNRPSTLFYISKFLTNTLHWFWLLRTHSCAAHFRSTSQENAHTTLKNSIRHPIGTHQIKNVE